MSNENIRIDNVEVSFPKLVTPFKNQFGGENYELAITVDASRRGELEAAGLKVKDSKEAGKVMANLKRKATKANGEDNGAPRVVDAQRNPMDADAIRSIGNGSTANVIIYKYDYDFGGNTGTSHSLTAVQITELVEFAGSVDFDVIEPATGGEASPF